MKNSIWNILEVVFYPIGLVVATPFFINRLGADQYGIWILANSIIAGIGVLNVGLGDATIRFVSKYRALKDEDAIYRVVQSNYTIYLALSLLLAVIGVCLAWFIREQEFMDMNENTRRYIVFLIPIGTVTLALRFMEQVFTAAFKGFERYDTSAQLLMISKAAILISNVILVFMGFSLIYLFSLTALISFVMLLVEVAFLKKYIPGFSFKPKLYKGVSREVVSFGLWSWLQSVFTIVVTQLDKLIVASFAGVTTLTFYSLGYMVYSQMHNVFAACSGWLFPFVSGKVERKEDVNHLYRKARFILLALALICILILYLARDFIFPLWLGEETYEESRFYIIGFMAYEALLVMSIIPYYFLNGLGKPQLNAFLELILKSLNLGGMLIFFWFFEVEGIIYGLVFSLILFIPFQESVIQYKVFNTRQPLRNLSVLLPSLLAAVVIMVEQIEMRYLLLLVIPFLMKWVFFGRRKLAESPLEKS